MSLKCASQQILTSLTNSSVLFDIPAVLSCVSTTLTLTHTSTLCLHFINHIMWFSQIPPLYLHTIIHVTILSIPHAVICYMKLIHNRRDVIQSVSWVEWNECKISATAYYTRNVTGGCTAACSATLHCPGSQCRPIEQGQVPTCPHNRYTYKTHKWTIATLHNYLPHTKVLGN